LEDFEDRPTLLDVPRLFTDEAYREYKTKRVKNPVVKNFREKTYNAMGDREKQEIIPYFTSKFVSFNTNRLIRNIIGQTKSAFTFEDVMNNQKILLINLSKGKIGEMNAQLLGMIIVSKIYNAAMARQTIAKKDRKDFYMYVDEFQNFVTDTFADILSEARKYRLCLVMAHQYIAQLESTAGGGGAGKSKVRDAVFGNV
jgi:type IV secretory pathway TraG/TraD family ATPase VirD4